MAWKDVLFFLPLLGLVNGQYYGKRLGKFSTDAHEVRGTLYAVDEKRILIQGFNYDGLGPDAYFYVGKKDTTSSNTPNSEGTIIANEKGSKEILQAYSSETIVLDLDTFTLRDIRWISVWCKNFSVNFGSLQITDDMTSSLPAPRKISPFTQLAHGLRSGDVTIMNTNTIMIKGIHYDGLGPDAFFMVGTGSVSPQSTKIPDENGSLEIVKRYDGKDITLRLPKGITFFDIDFLSLYCISFTQNFGEVRFQNIPLGSIPPNVEQYTYMPPYKKYGKLLGKFSTDAHEVSGTLYAIDKSRILIENFNYDGLGPDAYFYVGKKDTTSSDTPNSEGTIIANEKGSKEILKAYSSKTIVLDLGSLTLQDIRWISVWCRDFSANFGWLQITDEMSSSVPTPRKISSFSRLAHGLRSGDVIVMDTNTIMIKEIHYDGLGPDAFFMVGTGSVSPQSTRIPDENGSLEKVKRYDGKDIMLHLPERISFYDIDFLSLYCVSFTQNFGEVRFESIRQNSIPPDVEEYIYEPPSNCETLKEGELNVAWNVNGNDLTVTLSGAIDEGDYMAFGVSGSPSRFNMMNGDVTVVYRKNGVAKADDYFMNAYSLCSTNTGVCPDTALNGRNDATIMEYKTVQGITTAKYKRPLITGETRDANISPTRLTQIIWAIGGINDQGQATKHHTRIQENKQIQFGRPPVDNCKPIKAAQDIKPVTPWRKQTLVAKDIKTFTASIGPTGGDKGYKAITGKQSWGIAWYINELLIPEITIRRGDNVTFKVQGGEDTSNSARYHPFYITDDPVGGYANKNDAQKQSVKIFAGQSQGKSMDKAVGRYCEYVSSLRNPPESYNTFEDYKATLKLQCDNGDPGMFTWFVEKNTPDTVYYQCYTHNYLGWKIHVVDEYTDSSSCLSLNILMQCASLLVILFINVIQ